MGAGSGLENEHIPGFAKTLRVARGTITKYKRDTVNPIPCMKIGRRYLYDLDKVKERIIEEALEELERQIRRLHGSPVSQSR